LIVRSKNDVQNGCNGRYSDLIIGRKLNYDEILDSHSYRNIIIIIIIIILLPLLLPFLLLVLLLLLLLLLLILWLPYTRRIKTSPTALLQLSLSCATCLKNNSQNRI
jgi:membrane protein implicated in regulation of membrane protease activity